MLKTSLEMICCPYCKGEVRFVGEEKDDEIVKGVLECLKCRRQYLIKDGIPDFRIRECYGMRNIIQKALYDVYAPYYDLVEERFARRMGFSEEKLRSKLVSTMRIREGDNVLEVCIGTGGNIPYYRKYTSGLIVGIDISDKMLKMCREKVRKYNWGSVELMLGCAEYLPFKDSMFDRVLIGGAISWFTNPRKAVEEAVRVVKRNSIVVIYDQVSRIDLILQRDKMVLNSIPRSSVILNFRYLFDKHFYVIGLRKK